MEYLTWGDGPRTLLFVLRSPSRTDCRVVSFPDKGHVGTCSTSRAAHDVLDFVRSTPAAA